MLPPAIHDGGNDTAVDVVESSPGEREPRVCEVDHGRRKVDLAVEPRLDHVPVGCLHVGEMSRQQRSYMAGDQLVRESRARPVEEHQVHAYGRHGGDCARRSPNGKGSRGPLCQYCRCGVLRTGRLECRRNARPQSRGGCEPDAGRSERRAHGLQPLKLGAAAGANSQVRLAGQCVESIELTIEQTMQLQLLVAARAHRLGSNLSLSMCRARARRDMTVPTGAPVICAICL